MDAHAVSSDVNFLTNTQFTHTSAPGETIPYWPMHTSTIPINVIANGITIGTVGAGFETLSEANFQLLGGTQGLHVKRVSGNRMFLVTQTFNTVPGTKYELSGDLYNGDSVIDGQTVVLTAYSGKVFSGPSYGLGSQTFVTSPEKKRYSLLFVATGSEVTIGFRFLSYNTMLENPSVRQVSHNLTFESSPISGGSVSPGNGTYSLGENVNIQANPS